MEKDFLTQMDERVKIARRKAKNSGKTIRLKEQAKEYCIKNIQYHWLNSIPEVLETDAKVFVTVTISLGNIGLNYYSFDLPDGNEIKFDNKAEPMGIVKEIVDKLSLIVKREVDYEIHYSSGRWSLEVSCYW